MDDSVVCGRFVTLLEEQYELNKRDVLGKGKYGTVYKGRSKVSGQECAIKVIKKIKMDRKDVRREVRIIQKILDNPHRNIVRLMDWFETRREYVIVTELLHGGELFYFLEEKEYLSEADAINYIRQLLLALRHLHSHQICHLDLKPENIVLANKESNEIKLVDFGAARDLREEGKGNIQAFVGTPEFVAPEVIAYNPVTGAADMWALGVITYVMLSGLSPFLGDNDMETLASVTRADFYFPDDDFPPVSDDAKEFICSLLVKNPRKRLTATQALEHKWLKINDFIPSMDLANSSLQPDNKRISQLLIPTDNLKDFNGRQQIMTTFHVVRFAIKMKALSRQNKLRHVNQETTDKSKLQSATIKQQQQQQQDSHSPEEESDIQSSFTGDDQPPDLLQHHLPDVHTDHHHHEQCIDDSANLYHRPGIEKDASSHHNVDIEQCSQTHQPDVEQEGQLENQPDIEQEESQPDVEQKGQLESQPYIEQEESQPDVEQKGQLESQPDVEQEESQLDIELEESQLENQRDVERECHLESQPDIEQEESQPDVEQEGQLESQPDVEQEGQLESQPDVDQEESQPDVEKRNQLENQPDVEKRNQLENQPDVERQYHLESQPDVKQEGQLENQPDVEQEGQLESQPDVEQEESQPDVEQEGQLESQPDAEQEVQLGNQPDVEQDTQPEQVEGIGLSTQLYDNSGQTARESSLAPRTAYDNFSHSNNGITEDEPLVTGAYECSQQAHSQPFHSSQPLCKSHSDQQLQVTSEIQPDTECTTVPHEMQRTDDPDSDSESNSVTETAVSNVEPCCWQELKIEGIVQPDSHKSSNQLDVKRLSCQAWDSPDEVTSPTKDPTKDQSQIVKFPCKGRDSDPMEDCASSLCYPVGRSNSWSTLVNDKPSLQKPQQASISII